MSQCRKFAPNIFHKSKCSNCFRQREEHSAEALECNRASRSIARSGYLFVAPDWDFSVPLNRTKRWQRRWFVLFDDGQLNYSVDEHPDTVPQGSVDMSKVLEVTGAEQITGHPHSLALTGPDRVTFVKAASREDARWWAELLAVFPRRHKRNATFPGGRASPSLPQLGRSASPQLPRARHLSCTALSPRVIFTASQKEPETVTSKRCSQEEAQAGTRLRDSSANWIIEPPPQKSDCIVISGSPADKVTHEDKTRLLPDWSNERLRDFASAITDGTPESTLALPAEAVLNLKKGWLWYKERNTENEWSRRWWVLCEQSLNGYSEQDEESPPEVTIELQSIIDCSEVTTDNRYSFQIQWPGPTYIFSAVTSNIRCNWLQILKRAISSTDSPSIPATLRSCLLSSDEEYRTASEGGRRDSEDWGDLPPSPPLSRTMLAAVKDKVILRSKLPRNQSRQSTLDSVSTDELDTCKQQNDTEIHSTLNKQTVEIEGLRKQLSNAVIEVQCLEAELVRCKRLQSESLEREQQAKDTIAKLEKAEVDLNLKLKQMDDNHNREQKVLRCRLFEIEQFSERTEEKYLLIATELQAKQQVISNLQKELDCLNEGYNKNREENDRLYKKIQEFECRPYGRKRLNSLTDLVEINIDLNLENLDHAKLVEQCLDLRSRLETAVIEIKVMKKELRESHVKYDRLELEAISLKEKLEIVEQETIAQSVFMADRVQDLTAKLATAEKQARSLKSKLQDSREKRRSLSLKGRENFSINKEIEDKITELEAKILTCERSRSRRKHRQEKSSETISPSNDKSLRRIRRKSLDSATSSEPMKLLMRLNNLETKITSVMNSNESLHTSSTNCCEMKTDEIDSKNLSAESVILAAIEKLNDCKYAFNLLKINRNSLLISDFNTLENNLSELGVTLNSKISENEINVIYSSANATVRRLENVLKEKLASLYDKRRALMQAKRLDDNAKLEILAEKIAYENVIVDRIHQALNTFVSKDNSTRLVFKESIETINLLCNLNGKLSGTVKNQIPQFHTSVKYLTKVLTKRLLAAAHGCSLSKQVKHNLGPILNRLEEEQTKIATLINTFKLYKLPQLADALAFQALNVTIAVNSKRNVKPLEESTVDEIWKTARETINCELIESEINLVMIRTAQLYKENSTSDENYFFSFFAHERATLELWFDTVETQLQVEMNRNIEELIKMYRYSLSKMQRQNLKKRLESEWSHVDVNALLCEFADVISHKSLIDARIQVLKAEYKMDSDSSTMSDDDALLTLLQTEEHWNCLQEIGLVNMNQSLEAEFKCMLTRYKIECENSLMMIDLDEVRKSLRDLSLEILDMVDDSTMKASEEDSLQVNSLCDVSNRCEELKKQLIKIKQHVKHTKGFRRSEGNEEKKPLHFGTEYLNQVESLRAAYRRALAECENHRQTDLEQLQILCEQVLVAMEHWHRKTLQDLREQHTRELHALREDKDQALAEETQATLAALDAMRKAHEAEVQREVAKFKQDFARYQQDKLLELTERLSVKCLEAAALEEQLGSATRQLIHAQQHIVQLEKNAQQAMQN